MMADYNDELNDYLNKVVLMAPCYKMETKFVAPGLPVEPGLIKNAWNDLDIYWAGTETWEENISTICATKSAKLCEWAEEGRASYGGGAMSIKTIDHFIQVDTSERF